MRRRVPSHSQKALRSATKLCAAEALGGTAALVHALAAVATPEGLHLLQLLLLLLRVRLLGGHSLELG